MIYHNFTQISGTATLAQMPSQLSTVSSNVQTPLDGKAPTANGLYVDLSHSMADTVTYTGLSLTGKTGQIQVITDTGLIGEFYIGNGSLLATPATRQTALVNITATSAGAIALNLNIYLTAGALVLDNRTGGLVIASIRGLGNF